MRISKVETLLGKSNYEKLAELVKDGWEDARQSNRSIHELFCMLEGGLNFSDAVTTIIIEQSKQIGYLQDQILESANLNAKF